MSESYEKARRHPRIAAHVPVRVSTIDPETDPRSGRTCFRAVREYCANVSQGGAFILTREPLSPGRRLLVEIHVPDGEPIETVGRVAWTKLPLANERLPSDEVGVGVEFVGGSQKWKGALASYLQLPGPQD